MKTYGLIGYPVKHSLSGIMHNAMFKELGIDAEYKLFEVAPGELEKFFSTFKTRISGANVTIPYKESCIIYLDEIRKEALQIGAVNTIVLEGNKLIGYNTDIFGFLTSLKEDLGFNPLGKKAVIFGAGGASRAVSFGLLAEGIERIVLIDIDETKAGKLALSLAKRGPGEVIALNNDKKAIGEIVLDSELLVNATPCGMKESDPPLISSDFLHPGLFVFDLIYNPPFTPLIVEAQKKGCRVVNGSSMLLYQGARSFELWTKRQPDIVVMKRALESCLGERGQ